MTSQQKLRRIKIVLLTLLLSSGASANFTGNDTSNFNPNASGLDFVTVHGSDTLLPGYFNFSLFVNQASNTLPETEDTFGNKIDFNDKVTFADLGVAMGLTKRLEIAGSLSYLLDQQVDQVVSGAQFTATGLNEIKFFGKYKILERNPVGAAFILSFNMNQAENNPFVGTDAGPTTNIEAVIDSQIGDTKVAMNLGYRFRDKGDTIVGSVFEPLGNTGIGSLAASYKFEETRTTLIGEILAAKAEQSSKTEEQGHISSEALLGIKFNQNNRYAWHLGGATRLSEGLFTADWRVYAGLNLSFDILRQKEKTEAVIPPPLTEVKPEPVPAVLPQQVVYEGYSPRDVESLKDKPFDELAKKHEFHLRTEIPEKDFAGTKPPFEIIRLNNFDFEFGSSAIKSENYPRLNNLATYLATEPKVLKIRIEGHTDSVGTLERNRLRSLDRAESVKEYLRKSKNLDNIPIETAGFGADRPISENSTSEGRKQNRRVEIRILRNIDVQK
jgi:Outer membrane protein and related peptidoglycan-associated (lipo)proteins